MGGKYTESQKQATYKYVKNFDRIEIKLPKGSREKIREHAAERGESVNTFISRAITEAMENDKK